MDLVVAEYLRGGAVGHLLYIEHIFAFDAVQIRLNVTNWILLACVNMYRIVDVGYVALTALYSSAVQLNKMENATKKFFNNILTYIVYISIRNTICWPLADIYTKCL